MAGGGHQAINNIWLTYQISQEHNHELRRPPASSIYQRWSQYMGRECDRFGIEKVSFVRCFSPFISPCLTGFQIMLSNKLFK